MFEKCNEDDLRYSICSNQSEMFFRFKNNIHDWCLKNNGELEFSTVLEANLYAELHNVSDFYISARIGPIS